MGRSTVIWYCSAIVTLSLISSDGNPAIAKTAPEINHIAKAMTVSIVGPNKHGELSQGSGVIIQQQGNTYTVLTAAHVVSKTDATYQITTPDAKPYQIIPKSIRLAPENIDLALVEFQTPLPYATAKIGDSNQLNGGMDLYVAGFPLPTAVITETVFVFREGKVTANSAKSFDRGYALLYSNDTLPGMSGGPVLNSEGELVGIHGRGDREEDTGMKTGFNAGIPIARFGTIAKVMGYQPTTQIALLSKTNKVQADDYTASALEKHDRSNYRGASADLNQSAIINRRNAYVHFLNGNIKQTKLKDDRGALSDYNLAIATDPTLGVAYGNRAFLQHTKFKDLAAAFEDYNLAIKYDPKQAFSYTNRGLLKDTFKNDPPGALADYNIAIQIDPNQFHAYNNRSTLKQNKLKDYRGALADVDRALLLDPQSALAYSNRGLLKQLYLNDPAAALIDFDRSIQLNPHSSLVYFSRATLKYDRLRDFSGALADYDRSIQLNPQHASAYYNRGMLKQRHLKDPEGAAADFAIATKLDPAFAKIIPTNHRKPKVANPERVLAELDLALQQDPNNANVYGLRGMLKVTELHDLRGGIDDLRQAALLFKQQNNQESYQRTLGVLKKLGVTE
jgi:tetratricopeptide (TPR) repeat protein